MKITIAFASRGICQPDFVKSLRLLQIPTDDFEVEFVAGYDVAISRNLLVEKAISNKSDYLLMIDDDIEFPRDTLVKLLGKNKDIISAVCFRRTPFFNPIAFKSVNGIYCPIRNLNGELEEVDMLGAACVLINMEVFKKIKKPYFYYVPESENTKVLGEDFYFMEIVSPFISRPIFFFFQQAIQF